jgi:hypothetical protein
MAARMAHPNAGSSNARHPPAIYPSGFPGHFIEKTLNGFQAHFWDRLRAFRMRTVSMKGKAFPLVDTFWE